MRAYVHQPLGLGDRALGWLLGAVAQRRHGLALLATVSAKESGTGPQTLYLVSPGGTRYQLGRAPAGSTLEDWSGASMDALFLDQPESGTKAAVSVLNLRTGQASGFTLYSPLTDTEISFTHPSRAGHHGAGFARLQRWLPARCSDTA